MNKLGFIVEMKDCPDIDSLKRWVRFAEENNIRGLELLFNSKAGLNFDASLIREALSGSAVEIAACGLWWLNTISPDEKERAAVHQTMLEYLDMAAAIDCKIAFFSAGEYEPGNTAKNIEELAAAYEEYREYAGRKGISIACYLGHKGNFVNSIDILDELLRAIPAFNIKIDPVGNIRNMKADPYEIVRRYGNRILHFHMKDVLRYGDDWEIEPPVGMGDINWRRIVAMLYHHQYNGYLIIEPHGPQWSIPENRGKHIVLSKRFIEQLMI